MQISANPKYLVSGDKSTKSLYFVGILHRLQESKLPAKARNSPLGG